MHVVVRILRCDALVTHWMRPLLITVVALPAACGGAGGASGGGGGFAAVLDVFAAHCTNCHDATKQGLPTYPQLSLTAGDAYAALVNKPADETCGGTRVVPGNPGASYLMQKLTQDPPCDGLHMPRAFEVIAPPPLTSAELGAISGWISAGAGP
jgi:hypothetical protein